MVRVP